MGDECNQGRGGLGWIAVGLTLLCLLLVTGCFEHRIRVEFHEDGSAAMEQSFVADAPMHAILRRNPDLAATLYSTMTGAEDPTSLGKVTHISRGRWEGLAIESFYPTPTSLAKSLLFSVEPSGINEATYEIELFGGDSHAPGGNAEIPADPSFVDMMWNSMFTNGPSISAVLAKGLLHGMTMDYTFILPGDVLATNGKRLGNAVFWHYTLDQMSVEDLEFGVSDLFKARPAVTLKCSTWPRLEAVQAEDEESERAAAAPSWDTAVVVPLDEGGAEIPKFGADVRAVKVSRLYDGDGKLQKGKLDIEVQFAYDRRAISSLRIGTSAHKVACGTDPALKVNPESFRWPKSWRGDLLARGDFRETFSMGMSRDSPKSVRLEEWSFDVKVTTPRANGLMTLTFPERGHYVVAWDGVSEPTTSPDPAYAGRSVLTSLAFVRGADAESDRLINRHQEPGGWGRYRRGKYLARPTGSGKTATMKLRCLANEHHYRVTFQDLVLP